jgi:phage repressor protein C with HTH and peptisase S24 domain
MAKNEQLKRAVEEIKIRFNLTQAEIAGKLSLNHTYFSGVINGKYPFSQKLATEIYKLFQVDVVLDEEPTSKKLAVYCNEDFEEPIYVPLLPISAQAGSLNEFVVSVKDSDCERVVSPIKGADFAMSVAGDSMSPEYPSGSQILIKKINEKAFIDWGKVYVLDTCNGTVIKKVFPTDDPKKIKCVSINPNYPPFELSTENDVLFGVYRVLLCMSVK